MYGRIIYTNSVDSQIVFEQTPGMRHGGNKKSVIVYMAVNISEYTNRLKKSINIGGHHKLESYNSIRQKYKKFKDALKSLVRRKNICKKFDHEILESHDLKTHNSFYGQ